MVCYRLNIEVVTMEGVSYTCSPAVGLRDFEDLQFPANVTVYMQRNKIVRL